MQWFSTIRSTACLLSGLMLLAFATTGCSRLNVAADIQDRLTPSNERDWRPELARTPRAQIDGQLYRLTNIRNNSYLSEDEYVVVYLDRQIRLDQIQSVDFVVAPFVKAPKLAHTILSFGLDDGSYLAISVEVRKELGEKYSPVLGLGRKYELAYVLSDERDVIRLRTEHHGANVYVYPTVVNPQQAQALFADVIERMNRLADHPEFYNSITNNCTTNLAGHVNEVSPGKINYGWKVLLPGLSAEYAYELGLLDNRIPFEDLTSISQVNSLAKEHFDDPDFSQRIRSRRYRIDRSIAAQQQREQTLGSRGEQYLLDFSSQRRLTPNSTSDPQALRSAVRSGARLPAIQR